MTDADLARKAIACLDLTDLSDGCTNADIRDLCARATGRHGPVAAVCVWPRFVAQAKSALGGSGVKTATVVLFPSGVADSETARDETEAACAEGADEIDMVVPYRELMEGRSGVIAARVAQVKDAARGKPVKAILETGVLKTPDLIRTAAEAAIGGGADFIKTSTGKTAQSATPEAARIMLEEIAKAKRPVGLKPSGGLKTLAHAESYFALADEIMGQGWATPDTFRLGASGLLTALSATIEGREATAGPGY